MSTLNTAISQALNDSALFIDGKDTSLKSLARILLKANIARGDDYINSTTLIGKPCYFDDTADDIGELSGALVDFANAKKTVYVIPTETGTTQYAGDTVEADCRSVLKKFEAGKVYRFNGKWDEI